MKKIVIILLLFSLWLPVHADIALKNTSITGNEKVKVGEKLKLSFEINFTGLDKVSATAKGIAAVGFELNYDDSILDIVDISSESFDSVVYHDKEANGYAVISAINEDIPIRSTCADSILYCDNYKVDITFYVKNAKELDTSVSLGEIMVGLIGIEDLDEDLNESDIKFLEGKGDAYHRIEIQESNTKSTTPPKSIIESSKPDLNLGEKISKIKTDAEIKPKDTDESTNNMLKSLEIEGYDLDFTSDEKFYDIVIENDVNSLDIKVETLDSKATYEIIGADDLKNNNYKVVIEVTAESGDKTKYTISAKTKEMLVITDKEEVKKEEFKLERKYLIIGGIVLGSIILIALLVFIIIKIRDRKVDKGLKNL